MNENTTNRGEKMDEKRITAVIAKYAAKRDAKSRHLHHHFEGSGPYVTIELLDGACPSCLRAHIARLEAHVRKLEAQAAAQGVVVVPERGILEDIAATMEKYPSSYMMPGINSSCSILNAVGAKVIRSALDALEAAEYQHSEVVRLRTTINTISASRALRDGEERIGAEELAATETAIGNARKWLNFAANWTSPTGEEEALRGAFARSLERLDALRTQTEGVRDDGM